MVLHHAQPLKHGPRPYGWGVRGCLGYGHDHARPGPATGPGPGPAPGPRPAAADLAGRTALVTGGAGGVGRACAPWPAPGCQGGRPGRGRPFDALAGQTHGLPGAVLPHLPVPTDPDAVQVAEAVARLCAPQAASSTGTSLVVGGGRTAR